MDIRVVTFDEICKNYKLIGYAKDVYNISELIKSLDYMSEYQIPITINTEDTPDSEDKEYFIEDFSIVFPRVGGEIGSYLKICVE